jgi:hypothetical protein
MIDGILVSTMTIPEIIKEVRLKISQLQQVVDALESAETLTSVLAAKPATPPVEQVTPLHTTQPRYNPRNRSMSKANSARSQAMKEAWARRRAEAAKQ